MDDHAEMGTSEDDHCVAGATGNVQCREPEASKVVDSAEQSNAADEVDSTEVTKPLDVPNDSNKDTTAHDGRLEDTSAALNGSEVAAGGADLSESRKILVRSTAGLLESLLGKVSSPSFMRTITINELEVRINRTNLLCLLRPTDQDAPVTHVEDRIPVDVPCDTDNQNRTQDVIIDHPASVHALANSEIGECGNALALKETDFVEQSDAGDDFVAAAEQSGILPVNDVEDVTPIADYFYNRDAAAADSKAVASVEHS
jgi:hypothetical protein